MLNRTASLAVLSLLTGAAAAQQSITRYTVIDLPAGFNGYPTAVAGTGFVSGSYDDPAANWGRRGFVWDGQSLVSIGTLHGETNAADVNADGVVVGHSTDAQNRRRAVTFVHGALIDLGTLTGGTMASAFAINNSGWIVGQSELRTGSTSVQRATLWRNNTVTDLGTLGGNISDARAVSDTGFIAGWSATAPVNGLSQQRAFRWTQSGGMQNLGVLDNLSYQPSMAMAVNAGGTVVGMSGSLQGARAFIWTPESGIQDLGVPSIPAAAGVGTEAWASGINDAGQVVGWSYYPDNVECLTVFVATLWEHGQAIDLSTRINSPGWTLFKATDINNLGEITAIAHHPNGGARVVLLRPIAGGNCSADFNGDTDSGTDADIEAFFACLAGDCCPTCGTADFNADGDFGTDMDIESFFRVLAGGPC